MPALPSSALLPLSHLYCRSALHRSLILRALLVLLFQSHSRSLFRSALFLSCACPLLLLPDSALRCSLPLLSAMASKPSVERLSQQERRHVDESGSSSVSTVSLPSLPLLPPPPAPPPTSLSPPSSLSVWPVAPLTDSLHTLLSSESVLSPSALSVPQCPFPPPSPFDCHSPFVSCLPPPSLSLSLPVVPPVSPPAHQPLPATDCLTGQHSICPIS